VEDRLEQLTDDSDDIDDENFGNDLDIEDDSASE
jgi:hypothetical protein